MRSREPVQIIFTLTNIGISPSMSLGIMRFFLLFCGPTVMTVYGIVPLECKACIEFATRLMLARPFPRVLLPKQMELAAEPQSCWLLAKK